MRYEITGGMIWVSEHAPRWKDWRGRMLYKHRHIAHRDATRKR